MKIRTKLIALFLAVSLVPLLVTVAVVSTKARQQTEESFIEEIGSEIALVDKSIAQYFSSVAENVQLLASDPVIRQADTTVTSYMNAKGNAQGKVANEPREHGGVEARIFDVFDRFAESHPFSSYVYLGTKDGGYIQWPLFDLTAGYDPRQRGWYQAAEANPAEAVRTNAYLTVSTGTANISTLKAIQDDSGEVIGVVGLDVSLKGLTDMIADVTFGEAGYLVLMDEQGRMLANPADSEQNFKALADLDVQGTGALKGITGGRVDLVIDGVPHVAEVHHSDATGFIYAGIVAESELAARASALQRLMIVLFIIAAAVALGVAFWAARLFLRPIQGVVQVLKKQAGLDFRFDKSLSWLMNHKNDEIGEMVNALAEMEQKMVGFVREIGAETEKSGASARNLASLSGEAVASMEEVKGAVEQVATLSEGNSAALQQTSAGIQEVSSGATTAARSSNEGAEATKETTEMSQEAGENVRSVARRIREVGDRSGETMKVMEDVGQSVEAITGFVDTITQIADQTNLLALNAAIEAARAGEHGRGFAVVAEEVRKLAEQSNEAAGKVGDLIETLQSNTKSSISAMRGADGVIAEVVTAAESTSARLDEALKQIARVNDAMQSLAAGSEEQAASSEEMAAGVDQVTKSTVEVTTHMESIRQSTEETSKAAEQVSREAEVLSGGADNMKKIVSQFRLDEA